MALMNELSHILRKFAKFPKHDNLVIRYHSNTATLQPIAMLASLKIIKIR